MAQTEAAQRARLERDARWCSAAIAAAPDTMTARQAYDLAHEREAAAARPGPPATPIAATTAPEPHRQVDPVALAIVAACTAAGCVELAAGFIARGLSVAEARHALAVESWAGPLAAAQAAQ